MYDPSEARNNHGEFGTTDVALKGKPAPAPARGAVPPTARPIAPAAHAGSDTPEAAALQAQKVAGAYQPLAGLPQKPIQIEGQWYVPGPIGRLKDAAEQYMQTAGIDYHPPADYAKLDKQRATEIADAFEKEKNDPTDPRVKASYEAMVKETLSQWETIKSTGLKVDWVKPGQPDPYAASPRLAALDVSMNNHWWGFPTDLGYGSVGGDTSKDNPLLRKTGETIAGREVVANDVFRIVHDMMGHLKEGNGFRAEGEDNAWRSHAAMYSDLARPAMTNETRGQNSWVNFGPYGEKNRTATGADTVFAPQKIGLLPDRFANEGRGGGAPSEPAPSKSPAQDLLDSHFTGKETMADVEKQLTPKQLSMVSEAEAGLQGKKTTQEQFMKNGAYTPERAQIHADIIDKMFTPEAISRATAAPGQKPALVLTGGRAASGKTSTLQNELQEINKHSFSINADDIQEKLPGYNGANAGLYHNEAQDIALQAENIAREHNLNVVYDATMKTQHPAEERVKAYKQAGYDVNGYFVHTSPVTSAVRASQRFEQTGRYVPPAYAFNSRTNEKTFDSLIPQFKKWAVYDNNGDKPKRVAHGENA